MKYIKNNQIFLAPITIVENGFKIVTNNEEKIINSGYLIYDEDNSDIILNKLSLELLILLSNKKINELTDKKILSGFVWNGMRFWLSLLNQMNFLVLYNERNNHPELLNIKHQDGFYVFNNAEEYTDFYNSAIAYIAQCIHLGWNLKATALHLIRNSYIY